MKKSSKPFINWNNFQNEEKAWEGTNIFQVSKPCLFNCFKDKRKLSLTRQDFLWYLRNSLLILQQSLLWTYATALAADSIVGQLRGRQYPCRTTTYIIEKHKEAKISLAKLAIVFYMMSTEEGWDDFSIQKYQNII